MLSFVRKRMRKILKSIDPQKAKVRKKPLTAKVRKEALTLITQRVEHHAAIMHLSYQTIKISTARRRR
ncbi:hypothetical protein KAZ93_03375 [Patescibacteria group bacterium]|nr:hypothetical protein [Patescibacteria group bacterium]